MFEDVNTKPIEEEDEKKMIERVRAAMGLPVDKEFEYDSEVEDVVAAMGIKTRKRIFTEEEKAMREAVGLPVDE